MIQINRYEKEVSESLLNSEAEAIKELEHQYKRALKDITDKIKLFQADIDLLDETINMAGMDETTVALLKSQKRSKVYQRQYQEILQGQVSGILDKMHGDNYGTIDKYLNGCYETGYVGTMYSIAGQGVPLVIPVDQAAAVKAVLTDSKVSNGLYNALGVNVKKLKKTITQEISRGIASSLPYSDIARNISSVSKAPLSRAKTIARTEGHRIQQTSARDAQYAAKKKGADVVRMWDSALDGRTRPSHARVDGEIRELDEKFSNGLMFPGDPSGGAAEVVNCRCTANTRARWALDEEELNTLKDRAAFFGIDKTKNFEDYKQKFLGATSREQDSLKNIGLQFFACPKDVNARKAANFRTALAAGDINLKIRSQKQDQHIAGTAARLKREQQEKESGEHSTFFYEGTDVEALLSGLFGTGLIEFRSENAEYPKEYISLAKPIGMAYNYGTKKYVDVVKLAIHYSSSGVHAYPVKDWD